MSKVTTEQKLVNDIMGYWDVCVHRDSDSDWAINKLVDDYASKCGMDMGRRLQGSVDIAVRNMTNSQKRELYKLMLKSGIRERV